MRASSLARADSISASPGRCRNKTSQRRSSWGGSCLEPQARPQWAEPGVPGSDRTAIPAIYQGALNTNSPIDRGCQGQGQRYPRRCRWISHPLAALQFHGLRQMAGPLARANVGFVERLALHPEVYLAIGRYESNSASIAGKRDHGIASIPSGIGCTSAVLHTSQPCGCQGADPDLRKARRLAR